MNRRLDFCLLVCLCLIGIPAISWANDAELSTYYKAAHNKKAADLKTALYGIIHSHTNIGYDGLLTAYKTSDRRSDGYLRDWYSNVTDYVIGGSAENASYKKEGDGYNREHTVPQSWFGSGEMKSDLVQVVPTDGYVNNRRGNFPFGENQGETYSSANKYSKVGTSTVSGFSGQCFEPNDEIKGDIARIYFYVLACYENLHPSWTGGTASQVFDGKKYPGLKDWAMNMFLRWARQDPVDDVERARNEVVYQIQKNRNPFVDYPSLCEYVWGDSTTYAFDVTAPHGQDSILIPDDQEDPNNPDPEDPDDPDPEDPENPDSQETHSGLIVFSELTWTATQHPTYGEGFTATANGLTLSYYKNESSVNPVNVSQYNQFRFYDKSVFIISGAEITDVVFYAADPSKLGTIYIDNVEYPWENKETITWNGSMKPFVAIANGQSRIESIDVTIHDVATPIVMSRTMIPKQVFDLNGRRIKSNVNGGHKGIFVVKPIGGRATKQILNTRP